MADNLRDRIAAVIENAYPGKYGKSLSLLTADWVIRELKLNTDRVGTLTRYVTEWKPNE